jgi:hypothetical protein
MKRSLIRPGAALLILLLVARGADAQSTASNTERADASSAAETATFLLVPVGARAVGMGGAVSASIGDIEGSLWNPASMAGLESGAVYLMGGPDFVGSVLVAGGIVALGEFRTGLTVLHYGHGTVEARDEANRPIGTLDPNEQAFVLSAAYPVAKWLDVGAAGKALRIDLCSDVCGSENYDQWGFAFDVGFVASLPSNESLRAGLMLRNLGGGISLGDGPSDPLPARVRLGLEMDLPSAVSADEAWAGGDLDLLVRLDVQETLSEFDDLDAHFGAELGFKRVLLVRGGYALTSEGRSGPTMGIGIRFNSLILDLGYGFNDFAGFDSGTPLQLSVGYGF